MQIKNCHDKFVNNNCCHVICIIELADSKMHLKDLCSKHNYEEVLNALPKAIWLANELQDCETLKELYEMKVDVLRDTERKVEAFNMIIDCLLPLDHKNVKVRSSLNDLIDQ